MSLSIEEIRISVFCCNVFNLDQPKEDNCEAVGCYNYHCGAGAHGRQPWQSPCQCTGLPQVRGLVRRQDAAQEAVVVGAATWQHHPQWLLGEADLIVFATPVRTIEEQISTLIHS